MSIFSQTATAVLIGSAFLLAPAQAAEIKVIATAAVSGAFKELIPDFERTTGHKVSVQYHATPVVLKEIEGGAPFDLAIGVETAFAAKPELFAGRQTPISTVGLGVGVRAGAAKPDLRSADSFKKALLDAKSVAILPDSVNGKHFVAVFDRLGIAEQMKAKLKLLTQPPQVPQAVASGEAELALFVSNLLIGVPGVDYAGPIPTEYQQMLVFTGVVGAKAKEPTAAKALLAHLTSSAAGAVMKKNGMEVPKS